MDTNTHVNANQFPLFRQPVHAKITKYALIKPTCGRRSITFCRYTMTPSASLFLDSLLPQSLLVFFLELLVNLGSL